MWWSLWTCVPVRNFMSYDVGQRSVSGQQRGCDEGKTRVFHSPVRKTRRQTQKVVPSPCILHPGDGFGGRQKLLRLGKLVRRALDDVGFAPDGTSVGNVPLDQVSHGERKEVRRNGNWLVPGANFLGGVGCWYFCGFLQGGHDTRCPSWNRHSGTIRHLHSATILARNQGSSMNRLALCK